MSDVFRRDHYARGASRTRVYLHGLFDALTDECCGVAWWLPPTRVTCESVNKAQWTQVLALSRLVITPGVPKNACSFLVSQSVKLIKKDGRFVTLVSFADTSQGHTGHVYRACNWKYLGMRPGNTRWIDADGKQVAQQSTRTRTNAEMKALGLTNVGRFPKHKYVLHLRPHHKPAFPNADLF